MRFIALTCLAVFTTAAWSADVESRVLTHYMPQDLLDTVVRTDGWTEITLNVKGGVRKGDTVRIWAGGSIDRGNGDQPGQNTNGPTGLEPSRSDLDTKAFSLSPDANFAFALLFKTEGPALHRSAPAGKPLEITLTKDKERLWLGFNDERGRFYDNHLGKGRRHELDPLWVRIEVVRTVVD